MSYEIRATEAVQYGWKTTLANLRPLLQIGAAAALLALVDAALGSSREPLAALLRAAAQALQVALALIWTKAALKLHDGAKLEPPLVFGPLAGYFTYLLAWVLYVAIVCAGLVLFVVPGVIWAIEFGFAGFFIADQKLDPIEALRASRRLTRGMKRPLFVFGLALLGLNLLGAMAFGVGLLVTVPASYLAAAWVYRRLLARASWVSPAPRERQTMPLSSSTAST